VRLQPNIATLKGRVDPIRLVRLIDAETEANVASIPTGESPIVNPNVEKPGTMTPPPRPK
jgi:hypothetical protein